MRETDPVAVVFSQPHLGEDGSKLDIRRHITHPTCHQKSLYAHPLTLADYCCRHPPEKVHEQLSVLHMAFLKFYFITRMHDTKTMVSARFRYIMSGFFYIAIADRAAVSTWSLEAT